MAAWDGCCLSIAAVQAQDTASQNGAKFLKVGRQMPIRRLYHGCAIAAADQKNKLKQSLVVEHRKETKHLVDVGAIHVRRTPSARPRLDEATSHRAIDEFLRNRILRSDMMVVAAQNPLQPRWSNGLLPDRLSAAEIDAILATSDTRISASAYEWAAATREGQEHLSQRSPQEWVAHYIDHAVATLDRSWRTVRMETPASRRDWAANVRDGANGLLEYLNAKPGYDPADIDDITPTIMALTRPHDVPLSMARLVDDEMVELLLPLLSEIEPRTTRPRPYWITFVEALNQRNARRIRAALGRPELEPPPGPLLSDALRMAIAGLQIISLRAQALFEITAAEVGRKPEAGGRAIVYFARQVGDCYRKLSGQRLPSDTPPGHTKPRRAETRFYQAVCMKASLVLRDGSPDLVTILRGRGQPHGFATAENDLREAWSSGGALPRKR